MLGLGMGLGLGSNVAAQSGGGGGFTPPTGTLVWLENVPTKLFTDAGSTVVSADGQAVQQWNGSFGTSANAGQATLANRPLYKTDLSKPSLKFDGINDFIQATGLSLLDETGQHWVAVSCQFDSIAATEAVLAVEQSTGSFLDISWIRNIAGGTSKITSFDNSAAGTDDNGGSLAANTPVVLIGTVTSTAAEIFVDNASGGSTALSGTRQSGTATINLGSENGTTWFAGRIFGAAAGTGILSSSDRASVQSRLAGLHP